MQRPPMSSAASRTTNRLPAAASRRPAARPAAPAPTTTASTQPERGTSGAGAGRGAATAGAAVSAAADARNDLRVKYRIWAQALGASRFSTERVPGMSKFFFIIIAVTLSPSAAPVLQALLLSAWFQGRRYRAPHSR